MSAYASVTSVGGLLPTSLLERVRSGDAKIPGTSPESYGLVPGERIGDHVTRSWNRLRGVWESYTKQLALLPESDRATTLTRERWCRPLLDELGFAGLPAASGLSVDGKAYPISHEWGGTVPVHIMGARLTIDRRAAGVAGAAAMSPHGLVQEYLNRTDDHLWGIVTNGLVLRVLRDNASLTKQAFVEFDLESMFAGDLFSDFVVLWLTCHRTRFEGEPPEKCLLEQWSNEAAESGTRALDKLRDGVESAITALGSGFLAHPGNSELRDRLRSGDLTTTTLQHEVLRVVYRLLFLLVAESRELLHAPDTDPTAVARYKRFYSLDRLRTLAAQRRGSSHDDLWTGLTVTMGGLWHDGVPGLGLSPLGSSLWSPDSIASLANARIDNRHLLDAIRALCYVRDDEAKSDRVVDYKNLGAEELGSIYESLLELHAEVDVDARAFALTTAAGNERKTTGSYYTPTSLISELLDSALDPVLDEAVAKPDPEAALLDLKVIDPAAGSGHFLIAAAHRIAGRLASVRAGGGEPAPDELRHALRDVVSNCIHAIDINPMAVELCKVSMWLEATEPGKPLSFLDHRIVCGNALLGTTPELLADGIPDDAFAALTGDDKATVTSLKKRNKVARKGQQSLFGGGDEAPLAALAETAGDVAALEEESIGAVEAKALRWDQFVSSAEYASATFAANLWCAAFVVPKAPGAPEITDETFRRALDSREDVPSEVRGLVDSTARNFGFLHWHLAFLDAFGPSSDRGFDVVLGNPPWEMVQSSEKEFFAGQAPEIAEAVGATRKGLISSLEAEDPPLFRAYTRHVRSSEALRHFLTHSGRYPLSGRGRINTYAVFAEAMRNGSHKAGVVGAIIPSGIATDDTTSEFFADLVDSGELRSLFEFENVGFFDAGKGHMLRFALLTLNKGALGVPTFRALFRGQNLLELADQSRVLELSREQIRLINPNTRTCPILLSSRDLELNTRIYERHPILHIDGSESQPSGYSIRLRQGLLNATSDSKHFLRLGSDFEGDDLRGGLAVIDENQVGVPVYQAKMVDRYDHRRGSYRGVPSGANPHRLPMVSIEQHEAADFVALTRYWVKKSFRDERIQESKPNRWMLAWRDVTDARASERTTVACALPLSAPDGGLLLAFPGDTESAALLLANWNSIPFDYLARQKVANIHLKFFTMKQVPVIERGTYDRTASWIRSISLSDFIIQRVAELCCTSWDMVGFAHELGLRPLPFRWDHDRRMTMMSELDALYFHLYGIDRGEAEFVLESFDVLRRREVRDSGEYRTKRLVLERYDAMAEAKTNGTEYVTVLDPPPADLSVVHDHAARPGWVDWYLNGADT